MTKCGQTSWNTREENRARAIADHMSTDLLLKDDRVRGFFEISIKHSAITAGSLTVGNVLPMTTAQRENTCRIFTRVLLQQTPSAISHEETLQALATFYGIELRNTTTTAADGTVARGYTFEFEGETYGAVAQCEHSSPTFQNLCRTLQLVVELTAHGKTYEEWSEDEQARIMQLLTDMESHTMNKKEAEA